MKYIKIILLTFILAFTTSILFEFTFITKNTIRYALVILLILIELASGFYLLKTIAKNDNKN
jgi:hypothetical protein